MDVTSLFSLAYSHTNPQAIDFRHGSRNVCWIAPVVGPRGKLEITWSLYVPAINPVRYWWWTGLIQVSLRHPMGKSNQAFPFSLDFYFYYFFIFHKTHFFKNVSGNRFSLTSYPFQPFPIVDNNDDDDQEMVSTTRHISRDAIEWYYYFFLVCFCFPVFNDPSLSGRVTSCPSTNSAVEKWNRLTWKKIKRKEKLKSERERKRGNESESEYRNRKVEAASS